MPLDRAIENFSPLAHLRERLTASAN